MLVFSKNELYRSVTVMALSTDLISIFIPVLIESILLVVNGVLDLKRWCVCLQYVLMLVMCVSVAMLFLVNIISSVIFLYSALLIVSVVKS